MINLPEISNLELQKLQVPGGWSVTINRFYALDPDEDLAGRQLSHIDPATVNDPWDDVLLTYFDSSCLWLAIRGDNRFQISLEWAPMGDRDGRYWFQQHSATAVKFSHPPARRLTRKRDDIVVTYKLDAPVTWADEPDRTLESRDRQLVASTLNLWLDECSRIWP